MRTRQRILESAAEVFDESGFAGASISDILERAGVTKGALYFHFPSKEAIARAVEGAEVASLGGGSVSDGLFLQGMIDLSYGMARDLRENVMVRASIRLSLEASFTAPSPGPYLGSIEVTRTLLLRAQGEGTVRLDIDVDAAARFVISAFAGVQMVSQVFTGRDDLDRRLYEMWTLVLPGIVVADRMPELRLSPPVAVA